MGLLERCASGIRRQAAFKAIEADVVQWAVSLQGASESQEALGASKRAEPQFHYALRF